MNRTRGVRANNTKFYNDQSVILNRVLPSFIHKYDTGQYYDTVAGETGFPFTAVRTSNAMQFDNQGRMVWAPTNMVVNSSTALTIVNACTSTLSSGVAPSPTGAATYKIVANAAQSLTGNDAIGGIPTPTITTIAGYTYCFSFYAKAAEISQVRVREPAVTGYRALVDLTTGVVTDESGTPGLTSGMVVTSQDAGNGWWRIICRRTSAATTQGLNIKPGGTVGDGVSGIYLSSLNTTPDDQATPQPYVETTGTAYYGPRFDYNPNNLQPIGLLAEINATNLCARSSPTSTDWTANFCSITDIGTQWGQIVSRFTTTSTGSGQFAFPTTNGVTPAASTVHGVSAFVKRGNHPRCQITVSNNHFLPAVSEAYLNYNFDTNTVTLSGGGAVVGTGAATPLSDGWIRLSFNITTGSAPGAGASTIISCVDSDAAARLAGTSTNGATVDTFGQQYEQNILTTSHIPTTGVAVTRAVDIFSLNPSAYFNATSGTIFCKYFRAYDSFVYTSTALAYSDGTLNNRIQVQTVSNISMVHRSAAVNYDYAGVTTVGTIGQMSKMATQYAAVGAKYVGNGGSVVTSGTAAAPIGINLLRVGGNFASTVTKAWIAEIRYYNNDLASNAQLQTLTT